jgi:hypothetical protein
LELKNRASRDPVLGFFGLANFTGRILKEQGEAHLTTSELKIFASFQLVFIVERAQLFRFALFQHVFIVEGAQPFRVILVGFQVGTQQEEQEGHHAATKLSMQNGYL